MNTQGITLPRTRVADRMVAHIAVSIFRGVHPPGNNLPPIRILASDYGVTIATAQRAVARLEEMGLLEVRHGSGMLVQDPLQGVAPSAIPYWLEALREEPDRAAEILEDFFELRRVLAVDSLMRIRGKGDAAALKSPELQTLVAALDGCGGDPHERSRAVELDMAISRLLLTARSNVAYTIVFRMIDRLVRELPDLQAAMYANPPENAATYGKVLKLLVSGGSNEKTRRLIEETIAKDDARKIARFRDIVDSRRPTVLSEEVAP